MEPLGFNKLSIVSIVKEILVFHREDLDESFVKSGILHIILVNLSWFLMRHLTFKGRFVFHLPMEQHSAYVDWRNYEFVAEKQKWDYYRRGTK